MIDLTEFNTKLEAGKTSDNFYHYMIELSTNDGIYHTIINKQMDATEIQTLYESIKDTYQIDPDYPELFPSFKLTV